MKPQRIIKISKYLSAHLRHKPERIGLEIAVGGWVSVEELLKACGRDGFLITPQELEEVVENNDKKRFSFDSAGTMIRANQGHSISIDLQLKAVQPPEVLYHGTTASTVNAIVQTGVQKMSRHHVHLSQDIATAMIVGKRRGNPVVFEVNAAAMYQDGFEFFCSDNGVWLVDNIPVKYLKLV